MENYLLEWLHLLLRWLHVITAIAWIGTSFHFVLLDNRLHKPTDPELKDKGVDGESWAVHGGGFYHANKYLVAPKNLPADLHWSYWESYSTWLSGFALLVALYFFNASTFLVDPARMAWSPPAAVGAALAYLVLGWAVYDGICRVFGRNKDGSVGGDLKVGALIFVYVCAAAWIACHLFAGRAAFLLTGAMLASIMSGNVLMVIIPGQRKVVAALRAGQTPDPNYGRRGKQRSVHNTYFTLPVIVAMLSNHYGMLYDRANNWLVLILMMLAGALIRMFFVLKHKGPPRWEIAAAALAVIAGVIFLVAPNAPAGATPAAPPSFAAVQDIINQRCVLCHNAQISQKNIQLHEPELIRRNAASIYSQAVLSRTMPFNNATAITEEERALLGAWYQAGAKAQ